MSQNDKLVERAAARAGLADTYKNAVGLDFATSLEAKRIILSALGFETQTRVQTVESLERLEELLGKRIDSLIVARAERPVEIHFRSAPSGRDSITWHLIAEDGRTSEGRATLQRDDDAIIALTPLSIGYYRLTLELEDGPACATIIVAPDHCWQPDWLRADTRAWGVTAQAYGLRREHDFGIGDLTAVAQAARGAGEAGASFLGLSPLHALFSSDRRKVSPYSPSSRLVLEPIYIDPCALTYFVNSKAARLFADPFFRAQLSELQEMYLIDYRAVWALKQKVLEALWEEFENHQDQNAFESFRRKLGDHLEAHAAFETLSEYFIDRGHAGPANWPSAFCNFRSPEMRRFREQHQDRIAFHCWLQWLADTQLEEAARSARDAEMEIGLYRDLAVGADRDGSEVWANPQRFAPELSIGAPPDALSPKGQDWGLPPFHPFVLRREGLAAFRDLVAANMRHAGAIRLDHAFQLRRLFLIPNGMSSTLGTYVDYPFEALLAVLRVESHRARCVVIGEDLGNPPDHFSDAIMDNDIFGYRVVPFERTDGGRFKRPASYPRKTLAVTSTHDLPTLVGWRRGLDIDLRECFGVYDAREAGQERQRRNDECRLFEEALKEENLSPSSSDRSTLKDSAFRFLARTHSSLTSVQFEDVLGTLNQANLPGLAHGHPNWQRRLDQTTEAIIRSNGPLNKAGALFADEKRGLRIRRSRLAAPPPTATYRLQFNKDFNFDDAIVILPYLSALGISHVYASPIQAATPGSMHGYDIVDPTRINPELGGDAGFDRLAAALRANDLALVVDIVPNHLSIAGSANPWWLSVLEWGEHSPHSQIFDIDWKRPGAEGKVILPILGAPFSTTLQKGLFKLEFDGDRGSIGLRYHNDYFSLSPVDYGPILELAATFSGPTEAAALFDLIADFRANCAKIDSMPSARLVEQHTTLKHALVALSKTNVSVPHSVGKALDQINGRIGVGGSFNILRSIIERQAYRLTHWRNASEINYRRFFDIQSLVGIQVDNTDVFYATHALILKLIDENKIQGLRIDHIDGLADPEAYLRRLQSIIGPGFFIVAEKILEPDEALRAWPIAGTTGYDSLNVLDGIFVAAETAPRFDMTYREQTGTVESYETMLREAKLACLQNSFASELNNLVLDLSKIARECPSNPDISPQTFSRSLAEIIAAFPVYRTYIGERGPAPEDYDIVMGSVTAAKESSSLDDMSGHEFIARVLLDKLDHGDPAGPTATFTKRFRKCFQQLTGPVTAKSLEDTIFYRFNRFIVLNEVGGDPSRFGVGVPDFHAANRERYERHPSNMISSASHDTKRGEDTRARLLALSSMPEQWSSALVSWRKCIEAIGGNQSMPDANDQYFLLQTMLGAWPIELLHGSASTNLVDFIERLKTYMRKALRESKRRSSWTAPNVAYENAVFALIDRLLSDESGFIAAFRPLARCLAFHGMLISLARLVLKCAMPGFPDIYQGTELWDLSLVDPDNRRPVAYCCRRAFLRSDRSLRECAKNWPDGHIKQIFLTRLLTDRREAARLYAWGDYRSVETDRPGSSSFVAFHRTFERDELFVAALRYPSRISGAADFPLPKDAYERLELPLPAGSWRNLLTGTMFVSEGRVTGAQHFEGMPAIALRKTA